MSARKWQYVHAIIFLIGIVLIVGGIATGKHGATIGGIIVAAVNFGHWQTRRRRQSVGGSEKPEQ